MTQVFVEFIKSVLDIINFSYEKEQYENVGAIEQYNDLFVRKENIVKQNYEWIKTKDLDKGLLDFLKEQYGDDDEVYLALLDFIYCIVKDVVFKVRFMDKKLEKGIVNEEDIFTLLNLDMQVNALSWMHNIPTNFDKRWTINEILGERLRKRVGFYCDRIPMEERDENTIVVLASQLLGLDHAPTKMVFNIAYTLNKFLNKKVIVVNIATYVEVDKLKLCGVDYIIPFNLCEEYNGVHEVNYRDTTITMHQVILREGKEQEINDMLAYIYELKPYCVWNIGTAPAILGLINQITTNIYTSCVQGYTPVKSDICYNYFPNKNDNCEYNRSFLADKGVQIVDEFLISARIDIQVELTKKDFGIPEDSFVIGLAGRRIMIDCNVDYLKIIDEIMNMYQQVHLLLIGEVTDEFVENITKDLKNRGRMHFIGFRKDYQECMSLLDLYVNSIGAGNGSAGANSLFLGKPIITLKRGDIYSIVGDEFAVDSMDEYIPLIEKYIKDCEFYKEKSHLAKEKYKKLAANNENYSEVLKSVLDKVR